MDTNMLEIKLNHQQLDDLEKWMSVTGIKSQQEYINLAMEFFQWAANETLYGRRIASMYPNGEAVEHHELPEFRKLVRLSQELDREMPSGEELLARHNRSGIPAEDVFDEMRKLMDIQHAKPLHPVLTRSTEPVGQIV